MRISDVTVKTRIWSGYIIVLALLAVMAVTGYLGLTRVDGNVDELDKVGGNATEVTLIDRNIVGLRRNVLMFTGSNGDAKAVARIHELETSLDQQLGQAIADTRDASRKTTLETMRQLFKTYAANVDKVVELRGKRDTVLNTVMLPTGAAMREQLTGLLDATLAVKDFENAAIIGKAQEQLMLARLDANRFVTTPTQQQADAARKSSAGAETAVKAQLAQEKDPGRHKVTEAVLRMLPDYASAFADVATMTFEMDRIVGHENAEVAAHLGEAADQVWTSAQQHFSRVGTETHDTVSAQKTSSTILSLVAIALGLTFALVVARSITGPVAAMTRAMGDLAGGALDTVVPALGQKDEIGGMATGGPGVQAERHRQAADGRRGRGRPAGPGRGRGRSRARAKPPSSPRWPRWPRPPATATSSGASTWPARTASC